MKKTFQSSPAPVISQISSALRVSRLSNGFQIVTDRIRGAQVASLGIFFATGSRHEPVNKNGMAHAFEHCVYLGTKNHSQFAISNGLEGNGGDANAETQREFTSFYVTIDPQHTHRVLAVLSDILLNATFSPQKIAPELGVIRQEINLYRDSPAEGEYATDLFYHHAYSNQKFGRPTLGTIEDVEAFRKKNFIDHRKRNFFGNNMALVATGNVNHARLCDFAEKTFGHLPAGKKLQPAPARFKSGLLWQQRDTERTYVTIGYPGIAYNDSFQLTLVRFLSTVLAGTSASRLYRGIRNKGLSYEIDCHHEEFTDGGAFFIQGGGEGTRNLNTFIRTTGRAVRSLPEHLTKAEVERTRNQRAFMLKSAYQSPEEWLGDLGKETLLLGHPRSFEETMHHIQTVAPNDIRNLATKIFSRKPYIVTMGPDRPNPGVVFNYLGFSRAPKLQEIGLE